MSVKIPEPGRKVARSAIAADCDDAGRPVLVRKLQAKSRRRGQVRARRAAGEIPLDASERSRGVKCLLGVDAFNSIWHSWIENPRHDRRRQMLESFYAVEGLGRLDTDELNRGTSAQVPARSHERAGGAECGHEVRQRARRLCPELRPGCPEVGGGVG